jgi:hypothetical protein
VIFVLYISGTDYFSEITKTSKIDIAINFPRLYDDIDSSFLASYYIKNFALGSIFLIAYLVTNLKARKITNNFRNDFGTERTNTLFAFAYKALGYYWLAISLGWIAKLIIEFIGYEFSLSKFSVYSAFMFDINYMILLIFAVALIKRKIKIPINNTTSIE